MVEIKVSGDDAYRINHISAILKDCLISKEMVVTYQYKMETPSSWNSYMLRETPVEITTLLPVSVTPVTGQEFSQQSKKLGVIRNFLKTMLKL